jgi:DNA-binding MarR family transcriptional regulator
MFLMLSSRRQLIAELSELALPLMWAMRQDAVKACEPLGLRPIQSLLLTFIAKNMQHPKHIAEMLDVHPPAISALLADLESSGYLHRSIDPKDRRRIQLELTQAGQDLLKKVDEAYCEKSLERMQHLSDEELSNLVTIHRKLIES